MIRSTHGAEVQNQKLDPDTLLAKRRRVLSGWPTGAAIDLDDAVAFHQALPPTKNVARVLERAKAECRTLIQPRAGVASLARMTELLRTLDANGADILPVTVDEYTRHGRYEAAGKAIEESEAAGRSLLNGFPIVNHGVHACRGLLAAVDGPIRVRAASTVPGLAQEIAFAGGFTGTSLGGVTFAVGYDKSLPLEESIRNWQYVARLIGAYEDRGVAIKGGIYLPLSTVVPPCLNHAASIVDAILSVEQGVKHLCVGYPQQGHLVQDVAATEVLEPLTLEYVRKLGYRDVIVTTAFHQWMGSFPAEPARAFAVISAGALAAAISGATQVMVKTPDEAIGIPSTESNVMGIACTRHILNIFGAQRIGLGHALAEERDVIVEEVRAILDRMLDLGDGDIARGVTAAFAAGVLDVPFSPNLTNHGRVMAVRDVTGAVRFLDTGNLPFGDRLKAFHRTKVDQRRRLEAASSPYQMLIDDVRAIARGMVLGRNVPDASASSTRG